MDTMWKITEADRDAAGNIKVGGDEPRSLADLLPTPKAIKQDARRQPWTRVELATLAAVALMAALVLIYAWATPGTPPAPPQARQTALPTVPATAAPTVATVTPLRLLAAFASPDGVTLGTVEETRAKTLTARFGNEWVQADVAGSGLVWFRAGQIKSETVSDLPDLAPRRRRPRRAQRSHSGSTGHVRQQHQQRTAGRAAGDC